MSCHILYFILIRNLASEPVSLLRFHCARIAGTLLAMYSTKILLVKIVPSRILIILLFLGS